MLEAFVTGNHFPIPDMLVCSVGATCDDFSAIAQRLEGLGHTVNWWEMPHRRHPEPDEPAVVLHTGFRAPKEQVEFVISELKRVKSILENLTGEQLSDERLRQGIRKANRIRGILDELRTTTFTAVGCPLPALELLIAEMLAIHFCSDREESEVVLSELLVETRQRAASGQTVIPADNIKVFWVNPVADIRVMNLLEECGGRICGTEYMFCHALDQIPEDVPPMEGLARSALADPMVGSSFDRADRICRDIVKFGADAVVISQIPGASHCASEGMIIADMVKEKQDCPSRFSMCRR